MKKIIFIALLISAITVQTASAQQYIQYPFGSATNILSTDSLTSALTINNSVTFVDYGTIDTNMTVTCTFEPGLKRGAILYIKVKSDATARSIAFSTGMTGVTLSGTINKTKILQFVYDGTKMINISAIQID